MGEVIVYATMVADLFHRGHLELIKKAKAKGDYLIIGLHPDAVASKYKRTPTFLYKDRKKIIESIKEVDLVVRDCKYYNEPTTISNLKKHNVDLLVHGNDYLPPSYIKAKKLGYTVLQVPYYKRVSSTKYVEEIRRGSE